jgi:Tfp pilus assembly protein FimT
MRTRRNQSAGYTLSELLTVVAMVGVITLVTLPAFLQLMPQYRIRGAATETAAAIRMIRQRALSTRIPWRIHFDPTNERFSYYMLDTDLNAASADLRAATSWVQMDQDMQIADNQDDPWVRTTAVDLRTNTSNPFKDICPAGGGVDLIFLRDGSVSNVANCSDAATAVLAFTTPPSIVFAVDNSYVRYNRYYIAVTEAGAVSVTPTKE